MQTHFRKIPLAAAAASLTFGACSDDPPSNKDVANAASDFAAAACNKHFECGSDDVEADFDNVKGCRQYYESLYSEGDIAEIADIADDPVGCREALEKVFTCYAAYYDSVSCEELNTDDYAKEDPGCVRQMESVEGACSEARDGAADHE